MGVGQKEILWNLAENVGEDDLNDMQRFLRAVIADWQWGQGGSFQGVQDAGAAGVDRTKAIYSLGDSGAPFPTATALQITNLSGPIGMWKTGSPTFPIANTALATNWGSDPYFLLYWLAPGELVNVHAVGDATNPRWDLFCIKLNDVDNDAADEETRLQKQVVGSDFVISSDDFVKRRKVTCDRQLVQGTPAASPAIPAVPSGYLPIYAIKVPALHNAAFTNQVLNGDFFDFRMPVGSFCVDVPALEMITKRGGIGATYALESGALGAVRFQTAAAVLEFVPNIPVSPHSCRLIGVSSLGGGNTTDFTVQVGSITPLTGGTFLTLGWTLANLGTGATDPSTNQHYKWYTQRLSNEAGNSPPSASTKPVWGVGMPSGFANRHEASTAEDSSIYLGVKYTSAAGLGIVQSVRFHFAGMPY